MKRLGLISTLFILTSCMESWHSSNIARKMRRFDIDLVMEEQPNVFAQNCRYYQLQALSAEYNRLPKTQRKALREKLEKSAINKIIIKSATNTIRIAGTIERLEVGSYQYYNDQWIFNSFGEPKSLQDELNIKGEYPQSKVYKDGDSTLVVQLEYGVDYSVVKHYRTKYLEVYDRVENLDRLKSEIEQGNAYISENKTQDKQICDEQKITLKEISLLL